MDIIFLIKSIMEFKAYILPFFMIMFLVYETASPFYIFGVSRLRHSFVNISAGLLSFALHGVVFFGLSSAALSIDKGLVNLLPEGLRLIAALLIFDLWMYVWHRMNHEIAFFWRFHKAHHSDTAMDVTTAVRFHPIELVLSGLVRLPIYMLIGVNPYIIAVYESFMGFVVLFHHSNARIPEWLDDLLSLIIPTPRMHRIHHSDYYKETNSNYGTIFSIWDRLFGTFGKRRDVENIRIGLKDYRSEKDQGLLGFLTTPFR
jgi:sterol desaturase/sphingolipid hydroxylase (fatty acid hydroxylase superfamily)